MNLTSVATGLVLEFCDWDAFSELLRYKTDKGWGFAFVLRVGGPDRWDLGPWCCEWAAFNELWVTERTKDGVLLLFCELGNLIAEILELTDGGLWI
jgi:hypothetical protein